MRDFHPFSCDDQVADKEQVQVDLPLSPSFARRATDAKLRFLQAFQHFRWSQVRPHFNRRIQEIRLDNVADRLGLVGRRTRANLDSGHATQSSDRRSHVRDPVPHIRTETNENTLHSAPAGHFDLDRIDDSLDGSPGFSNADLHFAYFAKLFQYLARYRSTERFQ